MMIRVTPQAEGLPSAGRLPRFMFLSYCLFILYGSFIPFNFTLDPQRVGESLSEAFVIPYRHGKKNFSIPDVVSNILLFIPFGTLGARLVLGDRGGRRSWLGVALTGGLGLLFGATIEAGQLFTRNRTSSTLDAMANAAGATVGAYLGTRFFRLLPGEGTGTWARLLRHRPAVALAGCVALLVMADAFYPYQVTLDVSTFWGNLKRTQWVPFRHGPHRFLGDLLVEKVLVFALLGDLVRRSLDGRKAWIPGAQSAALLTCVFSAVVEGGKLLFVGRTPNAENFLLGSLGGLMGALLGRPLADIPMVRKRPLDVLFVLALLLIAYAELTPFDWAISRDAIGAKLLRLEWLPLLSHYKAKLPQAMFDLGKKLALGCALGALVQARRASQGLPERLWLPAAWGLGVGAILEALQLLQVSHKASTTDILIFGVAAWAGGATLARYRALAEKS
jgi:VanZ family protein